MLKTYDIPVLNYPVDKILLSLGSKKGSARNMWFSPLRDEKEASLHIDPQRNFWFDQGAGIGGMNYKLVMLARHCSKADAFRYIESLSPVMADEMEQLRKASEAPVQKQEIKQIRELQSSYLTRYIEGRKIPMEIAAPYLKELIVYNPGIDRYFTMVGFPNNGGGWAMNNPKGKKTTTKADITTIDTKGEFSSKPTSDNVAVFEGFWDFLSWRVMQSCPVPPCDVVVLNSVNNIQKAADYIAAHKGAICFLDNDAAGKTCLQAVQSLMDGKKVTDMSHLYGQHKDLNEMLQASRGYSAGPRLTPRM